MNQRIEQQSDRQQAEQRRMSDAECLRRVRGQIKDFDHPQIKRAKIAIDRQLQDRG